MKVNEIINIIEKDASIYEMLKYCPYELLKAWNIRHYHKGCVILKQGEVYDYFYIIAEGMVDIYIMAENGKKYSQAKYKQGQFLGELEIFDKAPYSCYIEAMTDITMLEIRRDDFLKWIDLDRNISSYITRTICRQYYNLSRKAGYDTLYSLKQRLCQYFISTAETTRNLEVNLDKEKLGDQLAVTHRSINRVLKELKDKNLIEMKPNSIVIMDFNALKVEEENSRYERG